MIEKAKNTKQNENTNKNMLHYDILKLSITFTTITATKDKR